VGFAGRGAGGDLVGDAARRVQIRRVDGASGTADIENDGIGTMTITLHKLTMEVRDQYWTVGPIAEIAIAALEPPGDG
jgi:hypothetical protein